MNKVINLTISIATRGNKEQLKECLDSIYNSNESLSLEIYVIDNNSSDGTRDMISNVYKDVKLIANKEPMGFSSSHNSVLKMFNGENIAILNDDTIILKDSFGKMLNYLKKDPKIGIIGPKMKKKNGAYQQSAFKFPNALDLYADHFLTKIYPTSKLSALYRDIELTTNPKEVDWLLGACLMIPRRTINKIGYLDEDFKQFYMEDTDFCKRIKNKGYKIVYYPKSEIIHHGAQTSQKEKLFMRKLLFINRLKFFKKHYGHIYYIIAKITLYFSTTCNIVFDIVRYLSFRISKDQLSHNIYEYIYIAK